MTNNYIYIKHFRQWRHSGEVYRASLFMILCIIALPDLAIHVKNYTFFLSNISHMGKPIFTQWVRLWVSSPTKNHCFTSVRPQPCQVFVCDITFWKNLSILKTFVLTTWRVQQLVVRSAGVTEQQNPALTWIVYTTGGRMGMTFNVTWSQCHQALSRQLLTYAYM